jgi:hypothetical protein
MPDEQHDRAPDAAPRLGMTSTECLLVLTRADGSRTETTVHVVHPRDTAPPAAPIVHHCDTARCPS